MNEIIFSATLVVSMFPLMFVAAFCPDDTTKKAVIEPDAENEGMYVIRNVGTRLLLSAQSVEQEVPTFTELSTEALKSTSIHYAALVAAVFGLSAEFAGVAVHA